MDAYTQGFNARMKQATDLSGAMRMFRGLDGQAGRTAGIAKAPSANALRSDRRITLAELGELAKQRASIVSQLRKSVAHMKSQMGGGTGWEHYKQLMLDNTITGKGR